MQKPRAGVNLQMLQITEKPSVTLLKRATFTKRNPPLLKGAKFTKTTPLSFQHLARHTAYTEVGGKSKASFIRYLPHPHVLSVHPVLNGPFPFIQIKH